MKTILLAITKLLRLTLLQLDRACLDLALLLILSRQDGNDILETLADTGYNKNDTVYSIKLS